MVPTQKGRGKKAINANKWLSRQHAEDIAVLVIARTNRLMTVRVTTQIVLSAEQSTFVPSDACSIASTFPAVMTVEVAVS